MNFFRIFFQSFFQTFPSQVHSFPEFFHQRLANYSNNYIEPLSSFLGLPNSHPVYTDLTWTLIAKNFFGWKGGWFYKCFFPFVTIYHLLSMLLTLPINILKLGTEFFPHFMCTIGKALDDNPEHHNRVRAFGVFLQWVFAPIHFVGMAITSPAKAIFHYLELFRKTKGFFPSLGYLALLISSLLITTVFYSIFIPLGIKLLAATVFPALPALLTTFMGSWLPAFNAIGTGICVALCGFVPGFMLPVVSFVGLTAINVVLLVLTDVLIEMSERASNFSFRCKVFLMRIGQKDEHFTNEIVEQIKETYSALPDTLKKPVSANNTPTAQSNINDVPITLPDPVSQPIITNDEQQPYPRDSLFTKSDNTTEDGTFYYSSN